MVETVKQIVRYMLDAHAAYSGTGMMMALYFVSLLFLVFYCKDEKLKKSIILPSLGLIGVMYVGVPVYDALVRYLMFYDGRMFWMLITPIVVSIGATLFVTGISDSKKRAISLVIIAVVLLYCGEFQISNAQFKKTENVYRLPQFAVDITEKVTSEKEEPWLIIPYTASYAFRQLSTDVHLLYGENATSGRISGTSADIKEVCNEMERVTPDLNKILPVADEYNVDYIIFDTIYTELCENGNLNVYGYPIDENYVGDRTSTVSFNDLKDISVKDDEQGIYWDLSSYGLKYSGTFGHYIMYEIIK